MDNLIDKHMALFNIYTAKCLSKLFEEDLLDHFVVIDEIEPNKFKTSLSFFVLMDEETKQEFTLEYSTENTALATMGNAVFDTVESLAGAALNIVQLSQQENNEQAATGLKLYYSSLEKYSHWELLFDGDKVITAQEWAHSLAKKH